MANPQGTEFLSIPLTNFSVAQMQADGVFIARKVLPTIPVAQQGAPYYVYPRGEWLRDEAKPLARGSESAGGGWTLSKDTYFANVYAFHKDNDDQDYANANATRVINLDQDATQYVTRKMQLLEDNQFAQKFMPDSGGVWDVELTGEASSPSTNQFLQWGDADATPIEDITNQVISITQRTGGFKPNYLIVPPTVYNALRRHPSIVALYQYSQPGIITAEMLARVFDIDQVLVAYTVANLAAEGAADDFQFLFGDNALLGYFGTGPGPKQETAAAMFTWTDMDGASALGTRVDRYRIPQIHSVRIEGFAAFDMKPIDTAAATLFIDTLAS
jgi:hypothetical protein